MGSSRREFVAGLGVGSMAVQASETLAARGGTRAVSLTPERIAAIVKWPRFGDEEKNAISSLLDSNKWYGEIPLLENEMKAYFKAPYVKSHMNATSAIMSMFFALDLPPGSEILAPSYTAWATTAPMHFVPVCSVLRGYRSAHDDV